MKMQVDVLIALFAYAGNGGVAAILPEIALWLVELTGKLRSDQRIGRIGIRKFGDVPLTMERNRVVKVAKDQGFDMILMLDSDNQPDGYVGKRSWAKPFWDSSFDFAFERMKRGIPTYRGFAWRAHASQLQNTTGSLCFRSPAI